MSEYARVFNDALTNDTPVWRSDLPGRMILNKFASEAALQSGRLKQMYLAHAEETTFAEIIAIFERFRVV